MCAAWLLVLLALGCHAKTPNQPTPAPSVPALPPAQPDNPASELDALEVSIDQQLSSLGIAPAPSSQPAGSPIRIDSTSGAIEPAPEPAKESADTVILSERGSFFARRRDEREAKSRTSSRPEDPRAQACALTKNICEAADRVCDISARLPPEAGAAPRCEKAKDACAKAKERTAPYLCP
jgi:hypothetical protein